LLIIDKAGRKDYDPRGGYLKDFHRFAVHGGSVTSNAPFGTDLQAQSGGFKPTSFEYKNILDFSNIF